MIRRTPRSTRPVKLLPYTALFRYVDLVVDLDDAVEVDRAVDAIHRVRRQLEVLQQRAHDRLRAVGGDLQPHRAQVAAADQLVAQRRSEEHTSELQSLMRISYAVFCLKTTPFSQQREQIIYTY